MKRKLDLGIIVFILPVLIVIIYGIFKVVSRNKKWDDNNLEKRYSTANIVDYKNHGKTGPPTFEYKFQFNNENYNSVYLIVSKERSMPSKELKKYIGKRFYVKFIVDYPQYSELLLDKPVPDSIVEAPDEGWFQLPE